MSVPDRLLIHHDDYHAQHIGRLADGRLFFATQPFTWPMGADPGCEYLAVYLFHPDGSFAEARIDTLGPRAAVDRDHAASLSQQRLDELGERTYQSIEVAPFRVEHEGVTFGLIPRPPEEDGDCWWLILLPGDYMAFSEPWDGFYDT